MNITESILTDRAESVQIEADPTPRELKAALDEMLLVVASGFILLMQGGFAMLESGIVRKKNSQNILIKNVFDMSAGAVTFWLVGFAFAQG